jgi:hypothetical protein
MHDEGDAGEGFVTAHVERLPRRFEGAVEISPNVRFCKN